MDIEILNSMGWPMANENGLVLKVCMKMDLCYNTRERTAHQSVEDLATLPALECTTASSGCILDAWKPFIEAYV